MRLSGSWLRNRIICGPGFSRDEVRLNGADLGVCGDVLGRRGLGGLAGGLAGEGRVGTAEVGEGVVEVALDPAGGLCVRTIRRGLRVAVAVLERAV